MFEEFSHFFQENKKDKRINDKGELVPDKCDKCGSKISVFLHGEPIYQCTNKKCKKYFGTVPCNINESYMTYEWLMKQKFPDPDSTSGTSDFDLSNDNDPDDCYCESSEVFTRYPVFKVNSIPFDVGYHGTRDEGFTVNPNRPLFVTPSIGMASIFAARPTLDELRALKREYNVKSPRTNFQYLEWNKPEVLAMTEPLKKVHVIIEGAPEISEPILVKRTGWIYAFDMTSKVKDHIYKSTKMKENEYCIKDIIPPVMKKMEVTIDVEIIGAPAPTHWNQESYNDDRISSKEELNEFYRRLKQKLGQDDDLVQEGAKLSAKDRNKLPNSAFALVYKDATGKTIRKYPVHKKENVVSAGHLFPRGVPLKYRKQVANRILREAHGYGIDTSGWNSVNAAAGKDKK